MESIHIKQHMADQSVLLLGSTGLVGKCLLEKLLRSVPTIKKIYCLIRPNENKTAQQRLNEVLVDPLFCAPGSYTTAREKCSVGVVAISGDLFCGPELGLASDDIATLRAEVTYVFNAAGSSKLDATLREAVEANVATLKNLLQFCTTLNELKCLVCVSSIYTNCDRASHIEEIVYSGAEVDPNKVLRAFKWMTDEMLGKAEKALLKKKPNAFVYSKWLAECLLLEWTQATKERVAEDSSTGCINVGASRCPCNEYIPIVIIRAAMIGATYREPFCGWLDEGGAVQPGDLFVATGRGYLRTMMRGDRGYLDIVPVDVLSGLMIATAAYTSYHKPNELLVYHCTSNGSLKTPECAQLLNKVSSHDVPFEKAFRRPNLNVTTSSWVHSVTILYSHIIPALFADAIRVLLWKKPYFLNVYRDLHKNLNLVQYFTARQWTLSNQNLQTLYFSLSPDDVQEFFLDPSTIDWPEYIAGFMKGAKRFILKEQECGIRDARRHLRTLRNLRWTFNFFLLAFLWRFFIAKSQFAVNLWSVVLSFVYRFLTFLPLTAARTV